jgi:hypothetical protein
MAWSICINSYSLWYQSATVDEDYPAAKDDACWTTLLPPLCVHYSVDAFVVIASINYLDPSVQKNKNLVYCDVISTSVRRTPRAFVPPCSDILKYTWKGLRGFSALDPAIPYRTWRR